MKHMTDNEWVNWVLLMIVSASQGRSPRSADLGRREDMAAKTNTSCIDTDGIIKRRFAHSSGMGANITI
jgi:hypothetical protein